MYHKADVITGGGGKSSRKEKKIKENENQIRDAFSLSLEIKSAYQVPDRINKKNHIQNS